MLDASCFSETVVSNAEKGMQGVGSVGGFHPDLHLQRTFVTL